MISWTIILPYLSIERTIHWGDYHELQLTYRSRMAVGRAIFNGTPVDSKCSLWQCMDVHTESAIVTPVPYHVLQSLPQNLKYPSWISPPLEKKTCANCATSRKQNTPSFTAGKVKTIYFKVNPIIKRIFVQSHLSSYQRSQYKGYPLPRFDQFIHIHFPIHCNKSPKSTEQKQ